jgi:hypothetical protein
MQPDFLKMLSNIDWQTVSNIASSLAVLLAVIVFICEIRANRRERDYAVFLRFVDAYEDTVEKRKAQWKKLQEAVQSDPKIQHEIDDRTSSLDYLRLRVEQAEPLYAIEHGQIEYEIRSLNLLNEICRYAARDSQKKALTNALFASEISYYQNRLNDLLFLRQQERGERLFSIPRYAALVKHSVKDAFQANPTPDG